MKTRAFLFTGTMLCAALLVADGLTPPAYASADLQVVRADTQRPAGHEIVPLRANDETGIIVSQKDKIFAPGSIEVKVGQPIEIHNDDATVHNAYCSGDDFKYNSGPQQPGTRSRFAFTKAGEYEVRCAIHPKMKLTVTVTE
jgi:plastocyanin